MFTLEPPASHRLALWAVLVPTAVLAWACSSSRSVMTPQPDELRSSARVEPVATQQATPSPSPSLSASAMPTPTRSQYFAEPDFIGHSPDGRWTASAFGYYLPIWMRVARADGSDAWEVQSDGDGWFEVMLRPVHWSVDGRYLYFTLAPFVDGFVLYTDGSGLQRLDLGDGQVTEILAGEGELQAFSISPDSARLAYVRNEEEAELLIVRDLSTGEELQWGLAETLAQAGGITWSPDASALVVLVTWGFSWEDTRTDLVLLNLRSGAREAVLEDDTRIFYRIAWVDRHTLYLEDLTVTGWSLDLETGEMILTPTPVPTQEP